jgi:hypothetical protein
VPFGPALAVAKCSTFDSTGDFEEGVLVTVSGTFKVSSAGSSTFLSLSAFLFIAPSPDIRASYPSGRSRVRKEEDAKGMLSSVGGCSAPASSGGWMPKSRREKTEYHTSVILERPEKGFIMISYAPKKLLFLL